MCLTFAWALPIIITCLIGLSHTQPTADYGMTLEAYSEAMKDPNAVAESTIPDPSGVNLEQTWPGDVVDGWKARIEIKADVETPNGTHITVTRISYIPPKDVKVVSNATYDYTIMDKTQYPCTHLYVAPELKASSKDARVDSCDGTLPDQCISDMTAHFSENWIGGWGGEYSGGVCAGPLLPESCRDAVGDVPEYPDFTTKEWSFVDDPTILDLNIWYYVEGTHEKGHNELYEAALNRVWILGTSWGYSEYSEYAQARDVALNASVTCLHALEKKSPSGDDKQDESSSDDDGNGDGDGDSSASGLANYSALSILL